MFMEKLIFDIELDSLSNIRGQKEFRVMGADVRNGVDIISLDYLASEAPDTVSWALNKKVRVTITEEVADGFYVQTVLKDKNTKNVLIHFRKESPVVDEKDKGVTVLSLAFNAAIKVPEWMLGINSCVEIEFEEIS